MYHIHSLLTMRLNCDENSNTNARTQVPKDSYQVDNMIVSTKYFDDMNNLTAQFAKIAPDVSPIQSFTGPFGAQGIPLQLSEYDEQACCIVKTDPTNNCTYQVAIPQCRELEHLWTTQIDTRNVTNYINVRNVRARSARI